jgi:hypothetical protein
MFPNPVTDPVIPTISYPPDAPSGELEVVITADMPKSVLLKVYTAASAAGENNRAPASVIAILRLMKHLFNWSDSLLYQPGPEDGLRQLPRPPSRLIISDTADFSGKACRPCSQTVQKVVKLERAAMSGFGGWGIEPVDRTRKGTRANSPARL